MLRPLHEGLVRGVLRAPEDPSGDSLLLTHGAGSNCEAPLLIALSEAFVNLGFAVLRYDLPFRQKRPHGPPPRGSAEEDQQGLREAVEYLHREVPGRVFLGGHSYGGRQASMLAAADPALTPGLLLLSYPLHPPKQPAQLRTAHFPQLRTAALFVHGSRDGFATHQELASAVKAIPVDTDILEVSAGHELLTKTNAKELPITIAERFRDLVETYPHSE